MGKILKRKIKHTLPIIVIFCLLNILTLGFSFNLNLNFVKVQERGLVKMAIGAQADTATTSVIVKNAPPAFSVSPTEVPTSTSTTPVNVGGSIGFQATGLDGEGDDYWLIICSTNSATSTQPGGLPTCGVTEFCLSNKASSSVSASCTYNNVTDPGAETQAWYAFVCDDHYGDPHCSLSGQGSGDGGSPFYVNHAPRLVHLYTSVDNQDPGVNFTFTASTSDSDVLGGTDHMNLYVCATTTGWTAGGGCGVGSTLCVGSSTLNTSISCTYATGIPRMHGAYTYYGFVKDWHGLAASQGNGTSSTYNVNNVAPTISNVTLNQGNNITLNIKNAPAVLVKASSTSVTDNNGCTDLSSATSTIYIESATSGANCAADDSYCYQIGTSYCSISKCSGPTSATAAVTCSTSMAFYAMPTDASSIASTSSWYAKIKVADAPGLKGEASYTVLNGVEVVSASALEVSELDIPYGTVQAGTNTGATNALTTIINFGNTPIDTEVSGTDMSKNSIGPEIIGIENQKHLKTAFNFNAEGTVTSSSTPDTVQTDVSRPTSAVDVSNPIYWGIAVPFGTPSANFYGQNLFTVVLDKYDNWQYTP
ncbi:MAG: hypothetical protein PHO56_01520 [Patescibacteria group bacterium]|nr:hypothetical protein [Patescibacteria group bacterium]